jgi:hypothetical protein
MWKMLQNVELLQIKYTLLKMRFLDTDWYKLKQIRNW